MIQRGGELGGYERPDRDRRDQPGNARDGVYRGIRDPIDQELASADFKPMKDSKIGELMAEFDIVLGRTPADPEPDHH